MGSIIIQKRALELQGGSKQVTKPFWLGTELRGVLKEQIECLQPKEGDSDIQLQIF